MRRQANAVIADETCPGDCAWVDGEVVTLRRSAGREYDPEFLAQRCATCDRDRLVSSPEHPHHREMVDLLDRRVNTVPAILRKYSRG